MGDSVEQPVVSVSLVDLGSFQGYDENGLCRSLNGRLAGSHKVLCSAGEIVCKGRHDFFLGSDGGCVIPVHSKIGHAMRMHFERLVNWYGRKQLIPVSFEDNNFNFNMSKEMNEIHRNQHCEQLSAAGKRVWLSSALVGSTKFLKNGSGPDW